MYPRENKEKRRACSGRIKIKLSRNFNISHCDVLRPGNCVTRHQAGTSLTLYFQILPPWLAKDGCIMAGLRAKSPPPVAAPFCFDAQRTVTEQKANSCCRVEAFCLWQKFNTRQFVFGFCSPKKFTEAGAGAPGSAKELQILSPLACATAEAATTNSSVFYMTSE